MTRFLWLQLLHLLAATEENQARGEPIAQREGLQMHIFSAIAVPGALTSKPNC